MKRSPQRVFLIYYVTTSFFSEMMIKDRKSRVDTILRSAGVPTGRREPMHLGGRRLARGWAGARRR
jgi:hypothetical protein